MKTDHTTLRRDRTVQCGHIRKTDHGLRSLHTPHERQLRHDPRQPIPAPHAPHAVYGRIIQCPLHVAQPHRIIASEIPGPRQHRLAAHWLPSV